MSDEPSALLASLDSQRRHVLAAIEGLDPDRLHESVLPSGWTPAGLVHHLAVDVERFWFRAVMSDDREAWLSLDNEPSGWQVPDGVDAVVLYRSEIEQANAVIRSLTPATPPAAWPEELFGSFRLDDLREVLLHVITETACHAGHLDAARELLDGQQFMVLG